MLSYSTMDTPAGPFTMVVSEAGAVRAAGFTADVAELLKLVHPQLREEAQEVDDVGPVAAAVRSYLDGDLTAIDDVRIEQHIGGEFITHAWKVMRDIKPGAPVTVRAFGAVCPLAGSSCPGPDGSPADLATGGFLLAGVPAWGLVARAGSGPWTQVGSGPTQVSGTGDLTFAVNDDAPSDNTGGFVVLFSYDCYPGNGNGDQQHYHCGPPGKT